MNKIYKVSKRFFPRISKPPSKLKQSTEINTNPNETLLQKDEIIKTILKGEIPIESISKKDFNSLLQSEVIYDKSKKDFPLLFNSDEEDFDFVQKKEEKNKEKYEKNEISHEFDIEKVNLYRKDSLKYVPDYLQLAAKRIFDKYENEDIREWTKKYLLLYSQNHAVEPPLDLTILKKVPFGNSQELDIKTKIFKKWETGKDEKDEKDERDEKDNSQTKEINAQTNNIINESEIENNPFLKKHEKQKYKENSTNPYLRIEYSPPFAIAYLYSRMPNTLLVLTSILSEIKNRNPEFSPSSLLDYGAGLGSGVLSALDVFPAEDFKKIAAVEPNKYMRKLGKYVTETCVQYKHKESSIDIVWVDSLVMLPGSGGMERGKFDLIILSHVLQEVTTSKGRQLIIETLLTRLSSTGVLVVVEPGSPKGFRFINDIRDIVISKKKEENEDFHVLAPCSHSKECPLAKHSNSWCHFSQLITKYNKSTFGKIKSEREILNEKYSYLVVKKGKHVLSRIENEVDLNSLSIPQQSFTWSRVIRPIIKGSRHVIVDICSTKGRIERRIVAHSHGKSGGYKIAKRTKWGDLWFVPQWIPNKFRKEGNKGKKLW